MGVGGRPLLKIVNLAKVRWLIGGGPVLMGAVVALIGFAYGLWCRNTLTDTADGTHLLTSASSDAERHFISLSRPV